MTLDVRRLTGAPANGGPGKRARAQRAGWRAVTSVEVATGPVATFALIANPVHLNDLTPGWFHLSLRSDLPADPTTGLAPGSRIEYGLRLGAAQVTWESVIETWDPPCRFSYNQGRGPYTWFWHDHILEPIPGGTRITDVLEYGVPGGTVVHRIAVLPMLGSIFAVRQERLRDLLGAL